MSNRAPLFTDTFALCEWLLQHLQREMKIKGYLKYMDDMVLFSAASLDLLIY